MQPWIETEPVAGGKMLRQPALRGGVDQRLDAPGMGIDLFCGLQRISAIDEYGGLAISTMARPAEPVKPVSQASRSSEGAIFVLLLVGVRNHESGQFPARQLLAKGR